MDCSSCLYTKISLPQFSSYKVKNTLLLSPSLNLFYPSNLQNPVFLKIHKNRRKLIVLACDNSSSSSEYCEFSGLCAPLVPETPAGKSLTSVFLNNGDFFKALVLKELNRLGNERNEALGRMNLSLCTHEAALHRRISEVKKAECRNAVEDIMYMLIVHKFSEIGVHLVPRLSKCIYNGRLEILPYRDWELQSIHSPEVLEMVKQHITAVTGWNEKANVSDNWSPTQVQKPVLCEVYTNSVLYGYFLKSASLRHHLEKSLGITTSRNLVVSGSRFSEQSLTQNQENLGSYVKGFDHKAMQMCTKPKSREASSLIEKHCSALFGDEKTGDEVVSTSLASLKRIVLEAVAFGCFLWESEECIGSVYKLEEN